VYLRTRKVFGRARIYSSRCLSTLLRRLNPDAAEAMLGSKLLMRDINRLFSD
jgi:hypothetical protein